MNPDYPSEPKHHCRSGALAANRGGGAAPTDHRGDHVAASELLLSLSEQRRAIDNAVIVVESDTSGVISYVNDKFCEISGYRRDEMIGHDHRFLNSGYHPRTFFDGMWATLRRGEVWQDEICNRSKSGSLFWLLTTITPVLGSDGKPLKFISVRVDITARKLAENVLAQQAQIIDQTHDAIFSTDLDGTLVSWNRGAAKLFGYSVHEALGQPVRFIAQRGAEGEFQVKVFLALLRSGSGTVEIPLQKKSGEIFTAHFSLTLLRDGAGQEIGVAGYALDITERKAAECAMRASEKKYRTLVEAMHDWVWEIDEHGVYTYASPRVREMLGYEPGEVLGKTPFDLMQPEEAERLGAVFSAIVAARKPIHLLENINLHRDGTLVVLETSGTPVIDEHGRFRGYQGIDRDITERKRFEAAVQDSQVRLAKAQQLARLGSWEWDVASGHVLCSDEIHRIFEIDTAVEVTFDLFMEHVHPADRELVDKSVVAALAGEMLYSVDFRIVTGTGRELIVHSEGEVEFDAGGKGVRMFGMLQDITERKQIEQEIRESREYLRELSSHLQTVREEEKASIAREIHDELGGNLTALKMDIYWLERKLPLELEAVQARVLAMSDVVDASVHAMRRIVTELRPTVLDDLGLLAAMQWQASEFSKRYNIQCKVSMHGEEIALAEELRIALFRIFQEALTNVARYSKASQVLVDMWREHDKIALEVFDNGIGIPEGAIMQPTSHGLRGMVERARSLGGSVEIGSALGEGVAISVRIPIPAEAP
jgi:PAS domain S-box-containing protein